jgi:hypothetical protein
VAVENVGKMAKLTSKDVCKRTSEEAARVFNDCSGVFTGWLLFRPLSRIFMLENLMQKKFLLKYCNYFNLEARTIIMYCSYENTKKVGF